jgi:hypothetical protein
MSWVRKQVQQVDKTSKGKIDSKLLRFRPSIAFRRDQAEEVDNAMARDREKH